MFTSTKAYSDVATHRKVSVTDWNGWYCNGPINHGLATPFLSYRVTLNACKTRDFIRCFIIWQSYKLGPLRQGLVKLQELFI